MIALSRRKPLPAELKDDHETQTFSGTDNYMKTFGIEWNFATDQLRLSIFKPPGSALRDYATPFGILKHCRASA